MEFLFFVGILLWIIFIQMQVSEISKKMKNFDEFFCKNKIFFDKIEDLTEKFDFTDDICNQNVKDDDSITKADNQDIENDDFDIENNNDNQNNKNDDFELINIYDEITSDKKVNLFEISGFEKAFLGNIFNKIGAIALIIGVILFIKIISPYIVFTPEMKISLGYIAGILLLLFGFNMNEAKMKAYKETLVGTAISILFVTTYLASALFELFEPVLALIIATFILMGVFIIADKQKTISMISIALIAGYLNPIIANADASCEFLFGYYIFLNLLSIIYVYRNPNKDIINFINLCLTFFILSILFLINKQDVSIAYPISLWVIYLLYDIVRKNKNNSDVDKNNILNWLNFSILALFTIMFFKDEMVNIGYVLLFVSLIYFGLVYLNVKKSSQNYKPYLYSALVTVLLFTAFLADGAMRIALWSLESIVLLLIAFKYNLFYLINWAKAFLFVCITSVLTTENVVYYTDISEYVPITNIRTLCFSFPITVLGLSCLLLKKQDDKYVKEKEIYSLTFISLIFLYVIFELNSYIYKLNLETFDSDFVSQMLISIIGFKYALQTKKIYNSTNYNLFNFSSYFIALLSLCVILTAGFIYKPIEYFHPLINVRFVAYLCAIITSLFYWKWAKNEIYQYIAVILGFILVHVEIHYFIASLSDASNIDWLLTFMWIIYAGTIMLFGIFKNIKSLKYTGIFISIFAILRIFIFDLAEKDLLYKFIAFLSLGIVLMIVSYFYNKKSIK